VFFPFLPSCSAFVTLADLQEFTEKAKNELLDRALNIKLPKRYAPSFNEAVEEICKAYDELPKSSRTATSALPDESGKQSEHLVKSPDDSETPGLGQMEVDNPVDKSYTLEQGSESEDTEDVGHERGGSSLAAYQKKKPSGKDPELLRTKKAVASKSALDMYHEEEQSLTPVCAEVQAEEQKVEKESRPQDSFVLDPNLEVVCALEVPKNSKVNKPLENVERKENKRADICGSSERIDPDASSDVILNMRAGKERRGFKKSKNTAKQSLSNDSEKRDHNKMHGKLGKQLTGKSSAGLSSITKYPPGSVQHKLYSRTDTPPAKRPRLMDRASGTVKEGTKSETKLIVNNKKDNAVKHERSTARQTESNAVPRTGTSDDKVRRSGGVLSPVSKLHSDGSKPAVSETQSTVDSAKKGSSTEDASDKPLAKPKRRACRFDDEEEEGQRTPVHGTSTKSFSTHVVPVNKSGARGKFSSQASNSSVKVSSGTREEKPKCVGMSLVKHETVGSSPNQDKTSTKSFSTHVVPVNKSGARGKFSSEASNSSVKVSSGTREEKPKSVGMSPVKHETVGSSPNQDKMHARQQMAGRSITDLFDASVGSGNKINLADRNFSGQIKLPGSSEAKKVQSASSKLSHQTTGNSHSRPQAASEKSGLLLKSEHTKAKPKPGSQIASVEKKVSGTLLPERTGKREHLKGGRYNSF
jgi:hypothetical protein